MCLEIIDLKCTYFTGNLPIFGKQQIKLRIAHLNNNEFEGTIPSDIKLLSSLEELTLAANELTCSLLSQIPSMLYSNALSVCYDKLKGTVALELSSLKSLKLFHLHSNNFDGYADLFDYPVKSFIADCGITETYPGLAACSQCYEFCNTDESCYSRMLH